MGIATLAGVLLVVIIVNSAGLFTKQSSKVSQGLNINDALSQMRGTVKISSSIAESFTDGSKAYTSDNDELVLKVASIDSSGNIIEDSFDHFVYLREANILRFKTYPSALSARRSADTILSTNLDFLGFTYLNSANPPVEVAPADATKVKITLALKQKNGLNFETLISTSEANLRND